MTEKGKLLKSAKNDTAQLEFSYIPGKYVKGNDRSGKQFGHFFKTYIYPAILLQVIYPKK